jgi:SM-20-related protein
MTAREMIDNLSGTLLCDERILSVPERELLANLLRRTRNNGSASETAVAETIARAVGEIVAERALEVLGDSLTKQLLQQPLGSSSNSANPSVPVIRAGSPPVSPPSPAPLPPPRPPGTSPPSLISVGSPPTSPPSPSPGQLPPRPPGTSPPTISFATTTSRPTTTQPKTGGVGVMEADDYLSAQCVILDEFLTSSELSALSQYVLEHEMQFATSEVLSPGVSSGAVDYNYRRSRVLMDLGGHEKMITDRVLTYLPRVLEKWGRDPFTISRSETQITASNHGDFFHCHVDNGAEAVAAREITFVYFFHREPKQFSGGELRIYDSRRENGDFIPTANYRTIVPEQNQLVLFASGLSHEITPVDCPSGQFADSRFTLNGWVHK